MSNVALYPCANKIAREHYARTVQSPVHMSAMQPYLSPRDLAALTALSTDGAIRVWGAKPGEDGRNEARWKRVSPGDYLLFFLGKDRAAVAQVTHTFHNAPLARYLWKETETKNGVVQTWEFMFALREPQDHALPTETLNGLIGRKPNAAVQEFVVLDSEPSTAIREFLSLPDRSADPTVPDPAILGGAELVSGAGPDREFDELDKQATALRRLEQAYLRKYILTGDSERCALCEREFPIEFLLAAHIKRRSECSDAEKRDFGNIAMPNCKFGCDELFERGLVCVSDDGKIEVSGQAPGVGPVAAYIDTHLRGKRLEFWQDRPGSRDYFEHHRRTYFDR